MEQLATVFKIAIVLSVGLALGYCQCVLEFPTNRENVPSFRKLFGTKTIQIPRTAVSIVLQQNESITGYCANSFSNFSYEYYDRIRHYGGIERKQKVFTALDTVTLYCDKRVMHHSDGYPLIDKVLKCVDLSWGMYESVNAFSWCLPTMGSYILASKYVSGTVSILAAVCLDVNKMTLQNLHYRTGPNIQSKNGSDMRILSPIGLSDLSLGAEVKNFGTIFEHLNNKLLLQQELYKKQISDTWLQLANYEYYSLVYKDHNLEFFNKYQTLLNTIWWENLYFGNWKRFMGALEKRSNNSTFNVYLGSTGVVRVPQQDTCTQRNFIELLLGQGNTTVPAYIWSYVQATNSKEDFVFIGYNSPFYDFFPVKDIIFCKDICDQVAWLNDIRSTFRYSTMGVTFCCSVDDVRSSRVIDGFPLKVNLIESTTSTSTTTSTTTSSSTSTSTSTNIVTTPTIKTTTAGIKRYGLHQYEDEDEDEDDE